MLVIRMQRTGRKNDASFRLVVGEKIFSPKSGKHLAQVGSYNPKTKHTVIDEKAVKHWLSMGAKASDTVHNLLINKKIIDGKKINILPAFKAPEVKEEPKAAAPVAEVAEAPAEPVVEEAPAEVAEAPAEEPKAD